MAAPDTTAARKPTAASETVAPKAAAIEGFELQVASLSNAEKAAALRKALVTEFPDVRVEEAVVAGKSYFRVRVGPFATGADTSRAEERLRAMGHTPVRYGGPKRAG